MEVEVTKGGPTLMASGHGHSLISFFMYKCVDIFNNVHIPVLTP